MEERFKITCLECGSNNVHIFEDIDEDYDGNYVTLGYYLECINCGNNDL